MFTINRSDTNVYADIEPAFIDQLEDKIRELESRIKKLEDEEK